MALNSLLKGPKRKKIFLFEDNVKNDNVRLIAVNYYVFLIKEKFPQNYFYKTKK